MSKTSLYPVLTPIKRAGKLIKPPALIELSAEEAAPLQAGRLIGGQAAQVPEDDTTTDSQAGAAGNTPAPNAGSTTQAAGGERPAGAAPAKKAATARKAPAKKTAAKK